MPGYMAGIVWDFSEFKKTGRIALNKISSSPPPVDVDQLAKEALEDPGSTPAGADKPAKEALMPDRDTQAENVTKKS
jgi:hypothetical protein